VVRVSIRTLGAFGVRLGNRSVPASAWTQRRASDLVKILALADGHRAHRDRVIDALWPDLAPEAGAANLHKAAHYARKALGSADAVVLRESHLALWPTASVEVDSGVFQAAAEAAGKSGGAELRSGARHPLIWSGLLHYNFESHPVRLRNISSTGAMIECGSPLRVGTEPMLALGQEIQLSATVAWVAGDTAGLRFTKAFDLTLLASARPEVAAARWDRPSYLQPGAAADSPWDEQWDRMSLGELRQSLEGFMKR